MDPGRQGARLHQPARRLDRASRTQRHAAYRRDIGAADDFAGRLLARRPLARLCDKLRFGRSAGRCVVQPYPSLDRRERISARGGLAPIWRRDGRELYYLESPPADGQVKVRVMAVPVTTTPTFSPGTPRQLFEGSPAVSSGAGDPAAGRQRVRDGACDELE